MVLGSPQIELFLRYQSHSAEDALQPAASEVRILPLCRKCHVSVGARFPSESPEGVKLLLITREVMSGHSKSSNGVVVGDT